VTEEFIDDYLILGTWSGHYIVNPWNGSAALIHSMESTRGWGLTWGDGLLFLMVWAGKHSHIDVFDPDFKLVGTIRFPKEFMPIAPHQIVWSEGSGEYGRLWIADTQHDRFVIIENNDFAVWRPLGAENYNEKGLGRDHAHINGCFHHQGRTAVICHNRDKPSRIQWHKFPNLHPVEENVVGAQIHNCWGEDGKYFTCSSGTGDILSLSGKRIVHTGGFPRGISITPNWNYVGISSHHFSCSSREKLDGEIAIYDKQWKRQTVCLLRGIGQMYELRVINREDKAHHSKSHEMKFNTRKLHLKVGNEASIINIGERWRQ